MSNRPRTIIQRSRSRPTATTATSSTPSTFSFGFDDSPQNDETSPNTGLKTGKIDAILAQTSGTFHVPQVKVKIATNTTATNFSSLEPQTIEIIPAHIAAKANQLKRLQPRTLTLYPPTMLNIPTPIRESHYIKECNPGVHVIYAPTFPVDTPVSKNTTNKKSNSKLPPHLAKLANKKAQQVSAPTLASSITPSIEPHTTLPSLETMAKQSKNIIPTWVIALDKLNPSDFDCPLSALPDLMLDPETLLLSLPNPSDKPRNIFVSISSPLRCITERGTVLESAYGIRQLRQIDDKHLIQSTNALKKKALHQPEEGKNVKNDPNYSPTHWVEQQQIVQVSSTSSTTTFPQREPVVLHESTTFIVVLPPKTIIDLCYVIPTFHCHSFPQQIDLYSTVSQYISTSTLPNDTTQQYDLNQLLSLISLPLNCQAVANQLCTDEMPLDVAQRYISSHISSIKEPANSNKDSHLPTDYIPIISFPLPSHGSYYISQSANGVMTHHSPQTRFAIDISCVTGTPVYAPCDGFIENLEYKSCSIGSHVTNLFDWNSVTLKCVLDSFIVPYKPTESPPTKEFLAPITLATNSIDISTDVHSLSVKMTSNDLQTLATAPMYLDLVHLGKIVVKKDQFVSKGQLIGYTGSTGFSPSPHLHIQISKSNHSDDIAIPFVFSPSPSIPPSQQQFSILEAGYAFFPETGELLSHQKHSEITTLASNIYNFMNKIDAPVLTTPVPTPPPTIVGKKQTKPAHDSCCLATQTATSINTIYPQNIQMNPFALTLSGTADNNHDLTFFRIPYHMALTIASFLGEY